MEITHRQNQRLCSLYAYKCYATWPYAHRKLRKYQLNEYGITEIEMTNKLEKIIRLPEDHVDDNLLFQITELRRECFPDSKMICAYFKQIPHFRYVVYSADKLIAQVGIDYRLMNFDGETKSVYGVVNLCVTEKHRGLGLASRLLDAILQDAISAK